MLPVLAILKTTTLAQAQVDPVDGTIAVVGETRAAHQPFNDSGVEAVILFRIGNGMNNPVSSSTGFDTGLASFRDHVERQPDALRGYRCYRRHGYGNTF